MTTRGGQRDGSGRKQKYQPETVARFLQAIELGATHALAAGYAGISVQTFYNWKERHPEFVQALAESEGKAALRWLAKIEQEATNGTWQAAAWKLERRYPRDYGRTVHEQEISGKDGAPLTIVIGVREDGPQ